MNSLAELVRSSASRAEAGMIADRRASLALVDAVRLGEEIAREVVRSAGRANPMVAVLLPSSVEAVTHLLAAILGDHTVSFLDPSGGQRTEAVVDALGPDVVVDATGVHPRESGSRHRPQVPGAAGYVAMSSGTTGTGPKGVLTTWECLADFVPHGVVALDVDAGSRWAEPNHPTYDLAITNWLVALGAGATLHVSGALTDRLRPLGFAARSGATHVRLAPGYIDLAAAEARRGTRSEIRVWGSGGDRLSEAQANRVLDLGVTTLVNTYGTSETAGFASAATYGSTDELDVLNGAVSVGRGRLGPWSLELVPEELWGTAGDVITVHSPHLGDGYLFGGQGQDYPRWQLGRVITGDLGVQVDGNHFCFGRVGRLVKRSASFVNLDDVDVALRELRGLATYTVATPGGSLVTLVEGGLHALTGVREDLATLVAPGVLPDAIVPVSVLPRLGNGKADQAGALLLAERALDQVD
jgi:acyl-CoA synthetase (AMP-forming)/AMP-acid ligase II